MRAWASEWARRRQGKDPLSVTLQRRRIYILPTRFGAIFAVLVFAMLVGSLNYGANLGFVLTFLLGGLMLVLMHHTHNNLLGVTLQFAGASPVTAGTDAVFRFTVVNRTATPRYEIALQHGTAPCPPVDVPAGGSAIVELRLPTTRRGWMRIDRFGVSTRHPGRLFKAWTWVHMDARVLVHPRPAPPGRPLPQSGTGSGRNASHSLDDADFAGLRAAAVGDPPQRIAWKAYARSDVLLLKQFAGGDRAPAILDFDALPDLDTEARLSQLARWCLDARADGRPFGLRLRGTTLPLGSGDAHLAEALRALALFAEQP